MSQGVVILAAGRVRSKAEKPDPPPPENPRRIQNTPRIPQQHGDRDRLKAKAACDEIRPTRSPIRALFYRSRVCGNRPSTALAINKIDECYAHRHTN